MEGLAPPRPLQPEDDPSHFSCGIQALDDWLRDRALANHFDGASRTYVTTIGKRIVGFYCLAASSIQREDVSSSIRRNMPNPIPAIILGRLAVDQDFQKRGLAGALLEHAILTTKHVSKEIGVRVMLVHAKNQGAALFYQRFKFAVSPTDELLLMARV